MTDITTNNYWNHKGRYQALNEQLAKRVSVSGEITGEGTAKLERFRRASNAYYDLFNNGGCNRCGDIGYFFNISRWLAEQVSDEKVAKGIFEMTEPKMDEIILEAAIEQRIGMSLGDFKGKPGAKLQTEYGTRLMVLRLCAGMSKDGDADGGEETIPVVCLTNGIATYEHKSLNVVPAREDA